MGMSRKSAGKDQKQRDLRQFLELLDSAQQLLHIKKSVRPRFEAAAVTAKLDRKEAALFENVEGSKMKVVTNVVGTPNRFLLGVCGRARHH